VLCSRRGLRVEARCRCTPAPNDGRSACVANCFERRIVDMAITEVLRSGVRKGRLWMAGEERLLLRFCANQYTPFLQAPLVHLLAGIANWANPQSPLAVNPRQLTGCHRRSSDEAAISDSYHLSLRCCTSSIGIRIAEDRGRGLHRVNRDRATCGTGYRFVSSSSKKPMTSSPSLRRN
jgi:hypothetical protein